MRRVFFSYHYTNDIYRVQQVREGWFAKRDQFSIPFQDGSLLEEAATRDENRLKAMIDNALYTTSVTVVLIGTETASRKYVLYEIEKSMVLGHGLLGVYIHQLKDTAGRTSLKGPNPLDKLRVPGTTLALSTFFATYDWIDDDGYTNLGHWIESAARKGRERMGTSPERCLV